MKPRATRERLQDMVDAIAAIRRYTGEGRERFDADELVRVWCLRHIEVMGEAASKMTDSLREKYPEVHGEASSRCEHPGSWLCGCGG